MLQPLRVLMSPEIKIYFFIALGAFSLLAYLYLLFVSKSSIVQPPHRIVVISLIFVGLISGLIRYSQIFDIELTIDHYLEIFAWSLLAPALCIGLAVLYIIGTYIIGTLGGAIEQFLKK